MGLSSYIILVLMYSCKFQSIESNDFFNDDSNVSFSQDFEQEKRSSEPKCPTVNVRVHNGHAANEYEFPFAVALFHRKTNPRVKDQFCVGSLITTEHVLTACHCLVTGKIRHPHNIVTPSSVDILAGSIELNSYVDNREKYLGCGSVRSARLIRVHKGCSWENNELKNDFALIAVREPFKYSVRRPCINVVYIPDEVKGQRERTEIMTKNHETCVTMGWGLDAEGDVSPLLKVLTVTLRPGSWCKEKILNITKDQDGGPDIFGPRESLCALGCEEGETTCVGDSGAPLLCGPNRILVGVASYGPGNASCGDDKIPFVYARVDGWELWIWAVVFNTSLRHHNSASIMDLQRCIMAALVIVIIIKETYPETKVPI